MASFLAALKAIPEIAQAFREFVSLYKQFQEQRIEKKYGDIKRELNELSKKVKDTDDREKLLDLVKRINNNRM